MELLLTIAHYLLLFIILAFIMMLFATVVSNLLSAVPFVPTNKRITKHMVKIANIQPHEKVYDLGCGDGRFLLEAQKHTKKTATGYENALLPYLLAKFKKLWHQSPFEVSIQNFFKANLADADVVFCYLGPDIMKKIATKLQKECRKGTRIYSNSFSISNMKPQKIWAKNKTQRLPNIYLYHI